MTELALLGGPPVRTAVWPGYRTVGAEEKRAASEVIDSGVLSGFQGAWDPTFYGGVRVRALEEAWATHFNVEFAIAVNSATSGLFASVGALGLEPGDEVIVPPLTMSATVMAVVLYGGMPVFADVLGDTFCLDPASVRERVTTRTRGIMAVHLFGHPADMADLRAIARDKGLWIVEDCAQAPGASLRGRPVGAMGELGVFSLNRHKHIQTGEGGVVTTNDARLADRVRLIRNHGEAVVEGMGVEDLANMVGFNFRMTELEAAIAAEQLKKLEPLVRQRIVNAEYIADALGDLEGITPPVVRAGARHVYYVQAFRYEARLVGVHRDLFARAVCAELPAFELQENEGPLVYAGYVRPLYRLPMFREAKAFGAKGYPFGGNTHPSWSPDACPVAEDLHFESLLSHEYMRPPASTRDLDDFVAAVRKVHEHKGELARLEEASPARA